jgi:phage-related protein
MRVVRLAAGSHWTVCAACTPDGCSVLKYIEEMEVLGGRDAKRSKKILSDLTTYAPNSDKGEWAKSEFSIDLGDGIFEYRWDGKGGVPRVLWFYDEQKIVVCVHAVTKKDWQLDPEDMELARKRRDEYFKAKNTKQLQFVEIGDFEGN